MATGALDYHGCSVSSFSILTDIVQTVSEASMNRQLDLITLIGERHNTITNEENQQIPKDGDFFVKRFKLTPNTNQSEIVLYWEICLVLFCRKCVTGRSVHVTFLLLNAQSEAHGSSSPGSSSLFAEIVRCITS